MPDDAIRLIWPERPTCHDEDRRWRDVAVIWRQPRVDDTEELQREAPFRTCSYCGSIHPEDLYVALTTGVATLLGSDWKYAAPPGVIGFVIIQSWQELETDRSDDGERLRLYVRSAIESGTYRVTASTSPDSPKTLWVGPSVSADRVQSASTTPPGSPAPTPEIPPRLDDKNSASGRSATSVDAVSGAGTPTTEPTRPCSTSTTETPPRRTSTSPSDATPASGSGPSATSATSSAPTAIDSGTRIAIELRRGAGWPHKFYVEGIPNLRAGRPEKQFTSSGVRDKLLDRGVPDAEPEPHDGGWRIHSGTYPSPATSFAKFYAQHLNDVADTTMFERFAAELSRHSGITWTRVGDGRLQWRAPYAGYQR